VLITHLHGDHIAGLPFIVLDCQYISRRKRTLLVAGPRGSSKRLPKLITTCYSELSSDKLRFPITYREIRPAALFALAAARVTSFSMNHSQAGISLGYRIQISGKIIAITGDTGWCDSIVALADGADLLLIEASNYSTQVRGHLSYREIASHRKELTARRIVLTHLGEEVLANARNVRLPIARDNEKFVL